MTGPTINPIGPKTEIPPSTANRIIKGWSVFPLLMRYGPRRLSISPTAKTPQMRRPVAGRYAPLKIRYTTAGTKTIVVPTLGINAIIVI